MFGMKVQIWKADGTIEVLRNVTEIHYNHRRRLFDDLPETSTLRELMIAFESDIHQGGVNMSFDNVVEFETSMETEKVEL